jgi:hypothetical protein
MDAYIKGKVMQPIAQIAGCARLAGEAVELFDEQTFSVIYEARQLLHRAHTVRSGCDALLLRMD